MDNLFLLMFFISSIALIVGLISPKTIIRWSASEPTRKNILKYFGSAIIISFIGFGIVAEPVETKSDTDLNTETVEEVKSKDIASNTSEENQIVNDENVVIQNENNEELNQEQQTITEEKKLYDVVRIIDGDTIVLKINNKDESIRLIGINTPETKDPRKPVECFGYEATKKAKELLENQQVTLTKDPTQNTRDKYGRLLGYIHTKDGLFFNLEMVKQGYAYEYTYQTPYQYQTAFKQAQLEAQGAKLGLWASNTCNGELKADTEEQENTNTVVKPTDNTTNTPPVPTTETSTSTSNEIVTTPAPENPSETTQTKCNIKGNISSSGEKIYHYPSCASYTRTKIDESKGERWFCTSEEARTAGWREALNCH